MESIKSQTYKNFELVIVDDCSKDDTVQVLSSWLDKNADFNYHLMTNKKNIGICASLNRALEQCSGSYISVLACDDTIEPKKIEIQLSFLLNNNKYGAVYSDAYIMNSRSQLTRSTWMNIAGLDKPQGQVYKLLFKRNFILPQTLLIRKEVFDKIGNYNESLTCEDYDFHLRMSKEFLIGYSDYISVKYRKHRKNTSTNSFTVHGRSMLKLLSQHLKYAEESKDTLISNIELNLLGILSQDFHLGHTLYNEYKDNIDFSRIVHIAGNSKFISKTIFYLPFKYRYYLYPIRTLISKLVNKGSINQP